MKILIAGGAGFIGSNLCDFLLRKKHNVIVVDDLSTGKISNLSCAFKEIVFFEEKIEELDFSILQNIDAVVHLAAQASVPLSISNFKESSTTNLLGTISVIDFCSINSIPLVYASSSAIYGSLPLGNDEVVEVDLLSPYAADKYAMENFCEVAHKTHQLSSVGLRFFNVYGPRQDPSSPYSGVISIFIDRILNKQSVTINGGYQTRDFVYVDDVVESIYRSLLLATQISLCEQLNVLTGRSISIDQLADLLMNILKVDLVKQYKPLAMGDPEESRGTVSKLEHLLKTDLARFKTLEEGLEETIKFISNENERLE